MRSWAAWGRRCRPSITPANADPLPISPAYAAIQSLLQSNCNCKAIAIAKGLQLHCNCKPIDDDSISYANAVVVYDQSSY